MSIPIGNGKEVSLFTSTYTVPYEIYSLQHSVQSVDLLAKIPDSQLKLTSTNVQNCSKPQLVHSDITKRDALNGITTAILYLEAKSNPKGIDLDYLWDVYESINDYREDCGSLCGAADLDSATKSESSEEDKEKTNCEGGSDIFSIHRAIKLVAVESDTTLLNDHSVQNTVTQNQRTNVKMSLDEPNNAWVKRKKRHQCSICKKRFKKNVIFRAHLRSHAGMHPFQCKICGRTYKSHTAFKGHMVTQSNIDFQCEKCRKTFQTRGNLYTHMRSHDEVKRYPCPVCGKRSSTSSQNICHLRTHTGEKPYQCMLCGKCFTRAGDLRKHESRMHRTLTS